MLNFTGVNKDLEPQELRSIIKQGTHLVIQSHDLLLERPFFGYCHELYEKYNIDSIIAINSGLDSTFHPSIQTFWPEMVTLGDAKREWVDQLKELWGLERTPGELVRLLRYQMLFKDGELVYHKHQPVKNHWQEFHQNRDAVRRMMHNGTMHPPSSTTGQHYYWAKFFKKLRRQDEGSLWERELTWGWSPRTTTDREIVAFLFFYDLWPNKELEDRLTELAPRTRSGHPDPSNPVVDSDSI